MGKFDAYLKKNFFRVLLRCLFGISITLGNVPLFLCLRVWFSPLSSLCLSGVLWLTESMVLNVHRNHTVYRGRVGWLVVVLVGWGGGGGLDLPVHTVPEPLGTLRPLDLNPSDPTPACPRKLARPQFVFAFFRSINWPHAFRQLACSNASARRR